MGECIFCKIAQKEIPVEPVYENEHLIAFNDLNPVAPVHILIIPKQHISSLWEIKEAELPVLGEIQKAAVAIAKEKNLEAGFRLVANCNAEGGQTVFHLHYHLLGGRNLQWPPG